MTNGRAGSEEPHEGGLPPQAPAYDMRTGEPLAEASGPDTDLGIWAPEAHFDSPVWPEPQEGSATSSTQEPTEIGRSATLPAHESPRPEPTRRPPWWAVTLALVSLIAAATLAVVIITGRQEPPSTTSTTADAPRTGGSSGATTASQAPSQGSQRSAPAGTATDTAPQPAGTYRVLAPAGTSLVQLSGGPTRSSAAFGARGTVPAGSYLRLFCTAYGEPVTEQGGTSRLWDATDQGWISDQLLETGTAGPAATACTGSVRDPAPSTTSPTPTSGPFAVIADGSLPAGTGPSFSSPSGITLTDGDLVALDCSTRTGQQVPPPQRLTGAGGNDQWDRLSSPASGWIPDSNVDSHTNGSAAPPC